MEGAGLDGLLKALEKYWGEKWTGRFATFMAVAVVLLAIETISLPLWRLISPYLPKTLNANSIWVYVGFFVQILGAMAVGSWILDGYRQRVIREQFEEQSSVAYDTLNRAEALITDLKRDRAEVIVSYQSAIAKLKDAQDRLTAADLAMETVYSNAVENNWLSDDQISELRLLIPNSSSVDIGPNREA